eukprot:m.536176 g.536176  ORF g.536176 m.536176 type:complete len:58 (+) comp22068_c0_seq3:1379-1552(+)
MKKQNSAHGLAGYVFSVVDDVLCGSVDKHTCYATVNFVCVTHSLGTRLGNVSGRWIS